MADEDNVYQVALKALVDNEEELREAFNKRAGKSKKLNTETIVDYLNDVSVLLAIDCEEGKYFFSQQNRDIPEKYDLNALKFEEFIELFKLWIKQGAEDGDEEEEQEEEQPQQEVPRGLSVKINNVLSAMLNHKDSQDPDVEIPANYEKNKQLLEDLRLKHEEEFKTIWNDRMLEEGQTKVGIYDCFMILQECFYLDKIDIMEKANDNTDFFRNIGSYRTILKWAQEYFEKEKGVDADYFESGEATMSFEECFEVLDYWLKHDHDVILVDNRKPEDNEQVKKTILETIAKYEKMIKNSQNDLEKQLLQSTVDTMKQKLKELENGQIKPDSVDETTRRKNAEKKLKALREIFEYYCTQQLNVGRYSTFDRIGRLLNTINLGTFKVLLKNFKLKINHWKLLELYKKSAGKDENLSYDEFEDLIEKVALRAEFAGEEKAHIPNPEIMKEYKVDSYKHDPTYKEYKKNDAKRREEEMNKLKKTPQMVYEDKKRREEEKLEEVWLHMGLYDSMFRTHMGAVQLAFNSQDRENFRIPKDSLKYKFRAQALEGKSIQEVQEEVHRRNELRKLARDLKGMEKSVLQSHRSSSHPYRKLEPKAPKDEVTYVKKQANRSRLHNMPDVSKLTMKKVENIAYGDIRRVDEAFNPHDLIDENDEEDNMYLAEYNIKAEKKKIKEIDEAEKRKLDEYGRLKKVAKGFAVNGKYSQGASSKSPGRAMNIDPSAPVYTDYNYGYNNPSYINPVGSPLYQLSPKGMPSSVKNMKGTYLDYDVTPSQGTKSIRNSYSYGNMPPGYGYNGYNSPTNGYNGNGSYASNNGYYAGRNPGYNAAMDRAYQIEQEFIRREHEMMNNIMNIQSNQMKKGLKIAGKN